jgi:hypothetical protein
MIDPTTLSAKQQIEYTSAIAFLCHYNSVRDTHFEVVSLGDTPDVYCKDASTNECLELEVTLLEDRSDDIRYLLGKESISDETSPSRVIDFVRDVIPRLIERLNDKLLSSYGANTALLIRQVGPLWTSANWQSNAPKIVPEIFTGKEANYGKGVWLLCSNTTTYPVSDDIFCIFDPSHPQSITPPSLEINELLVGKVAWETNVPDDFKSFTDRNDVDQIVRIPSPHGCEFAILIAFFHDKPEIEREKAIAFYRMRMTFFCPCGRGNARLIGNWIIQKP